MAVCATCRAKDSWYEQQRVARALAHEAAELGLQLHRLPAENGTRFGVELSAESPVLTELIDRLGMHDAAAVRHDKELKNNLYELDQVTIVPPAKAIYFNIRPKAHCRHGASYLRSRLITLELTECQGDSIVVPRPSLGPRVYGSAEYEELAVSADRHEAPLEFDWPFPIDLVYTWVDSDDPTWQELRAQLSGGDVPDSTPVSAVNPSRWYSRDELKYSLRSAWVYAPFARKIFIVTNGQVPEWLELAPTNIEVVTHESLYPDPRVLPTFNSNHIETVLHRIPGLAENFLYLNDDVFFGAPTGPSDFFTEFGLCRTFPSPRYLDERPVTKHDRATVAAHKNTRNAINGRLGVRPSQKFRHTPHPMKRSVWYEIEELFGDLLRSTRSNKFRSWGDINGQFLYCHYAMIKGHAIPSRISYKYLEVLDSSADALADLHQPGCTVFCLNDSNSTDENVKSNLTLIQRFFDERFPIASPWEKGCAERVESYSSMIGERDHTTLEHGVRLRGGNGTIEKFLAKRK